MTKEKSEGREFDPHPGHVTLVTLRDAPLQFLSCLVVLYSTMQAPWGVRVDVERISKFPLLKINGSALRNPICCHPSSKNATKARSGHVDSRVPSWNYFGLLNTWHSNRSLKIMLQVRLELTTSAWLRASPPMRPNTAYKYGALTDCATGARREKRGQDMNLPWASFLQYFLYVETDTISFQRQWNYIMHVRRRASKHLITQGRVLIKCNSDGSRSLCYRCMCCNQMVAGIFAIEWTKLHKHIQKIKIIYCKNKNHIFQSYICDIGHWIGVSDGNGVRERY